MNDCQADDDGEVEEEVGKESGYYVKGKDFSVHYHHHHHQHNFTRQDFVLSTARRQKRKVVVVVVVREQRRDVLKNTPNKSVH